MKLKPFDLEAAKRGEPICTRDGREARFIAHVPDVVDQYKVVVMYHDDEYGKTISAFCENGAWIGGSEESNDLFMPPRKAQLWVRAYRAPHGGIAISWAYDLKDLQKNSNFGAQWLDPEPRLHGEYDE